MTSETTETTETTTEEPVRNIARDMVFTNGDVIHTDGGHFVNCNFMSATLRYGGGAHPTFENCQFGDVVWHFIDDARRTIQFLQIINNSPKGPEFIADVFAPGKIFA
jgi:hypothetical protein